MAKSKNADDIYYPVPQNFDVTRPEKVEMNKEVVKRIIQGAVVTAFRLKRPSEYDRKYGDYKRAKSIATNEQMEMMTHLIESLQPQDAIEAALASQFTIAYIRGLESENSSTVPVDLFEFSHKALDALQKYRSKGAQQISVQYNVNQGQVVNIKNGPKREKEPVILEGEIR